jgi:hypothetical protein
VGTALLDSGGGEDHSLFHLGFGLATGHVPLMWPGGGGRYTSPTELPVDGVREIVRHPAPDDIGGFVAKVVNGPAHDWREGVEVLWQPGMELPPAPRAEWTERVSNVPARVWRNCPLCGAESRYAEGERERTCPVCESSWSDV